VLHYNWIGFLVDLVGVMFNSLDLEYFNFSFVKYTSPSFLSCFWWWMCLLDVKSQQNFFKTNITFNILVLRSNKVLLYIWIHRSFIFTSQSCCISSQASFLQLHLLIISPHMANKSISFMELLVRLYHLRTNWCVSVVVLWLKIKRAAAQSAYNACTSSTWFMET
jgi:hypothetical protein